MSDFESRISNLSPDRLALLAIDLHDRLEKVEQRRSEPLAIVGLGCRFPGGADGPEGFWRLLSEGIDAIREVPSERWDIDAYYDPDPDVPGKMATRWGAFLDDIDRFDAEFFGISPREADGMDPQQRMLLEVAWQALEYASISPHSLRGTPTGVYVGICSGDYFQLQVAQGARAADTYLATGGSSSVASGRLSYFLGLKGPAVSIDTACSSSLMAVHLACRALRERDCNLALAAGVNALLWPEGTVTMSRGRLMAPDGRCKTFDARADGFVRGEGCGVVVLKRLADAEADGDRVLAVIRGSAANQDGRSNGLTAPNGPSQQEVIRSALADGGVGPADVSYVEAHGTGTPLGDPIEVQALGTVLAEGRSPASPVMLGSVKTNIGHLEAAAGIAGLIKVVLSLEHRQIPKHLHFETPNPDIDWQSYPVRVATEFTPWNPTAETRIAGVSSFGFSGSNVHIVLEEPPVPEETAPAYHRRVHILPLSARSSTALDALIARYRTYLEWTSDPLWDIVQVAGAHRAHFSHRLAIVGETREQVSARISEIDSGLKAAPGIVRGDPAPATGSPVVFLFAGQGSQHVGMARELYETHSNFRANLDRCDEILRSYLEVPLLSVLYPDAADDAALLRQTRYTQPALFAVEYALAELWRSWGVSPAAMAGHSLGEYAAACVAGVFDIEAGLRLVAARARLSQELPGEGAMAAIFLGASEIQVELASVADRVAVAAVNGPESTVISGEREAVEDVLSALKAQGVEGNLLEVSYAAHSPMVGPMLEAFHEVVSSIELHAPQLNLYSTLTGREVGEEVTTAAYWKRHVRDPVQFWPTMSALYEDGYRVFLEVGPHSTLLGLGQQCLPPGYGTWLPSLRRGWSDWAQLMETLAELYVEGVDPDWAEFYRGSKKPSATVPTYPFQGERHWIRHLPSISATTLPSGESSLGQRIDSAQGDVIYESLVSLRRMPFLEDHRIGGQIVAPGPLFLAWALAAGGDVLEERDVEVIQLDIAVPMTIGDDEDRVLQTIVHADEGSRARVQIFSRSAADAPSKAAWRLHATCTVALVGGREADAESGVQSLSLVRERCKEEVPAEAFYNRLTQRGFEFGPRFKSIRRVFKAPGEALAEIAALDELGEGRDALGFHPADLDACLQAVGACIPEPPPGRIYVLSGLERYRRVRHAPSGILSHARLRPASRSDTNTIVADVRVLTQSGEVAAVIDGMQVQASADAGRQVRACAARDWLYEIQWEESKGSNGACVSSPADIGKALATTFASLERKFGLATYRDLVSQLEARSANYVGAAFRTLGWRWNIGHTVSAEALASTWGVPEKLRGFLERLLEILVDEDVLEMAEEGWIVRGELPSGPLLEDGDEISRRFPDFTSEVKLLDRCGRHLAEVLTHGLDPLTLLFPGGATADVEGLTRRSPAAQAYNTLAQDAFAQALKGRERGRKLRVLEIGAGTGGTTTSILPLLSREEGVEYVFTDVSPLFVESARELLAERGFVSFELLDIERNPDEQGYADRRFDIVIAANVLHATRDLRESLAHVRTLLAPGGLLLLLEGTTKQRWVDLTFGLTDGWWRFADRNLRPNHPLLTSEKWLDLLTEEGFDESLALPEIDASSAGSHAVVLARRGADRVDRSGCDRDGRWLILADIGGAGSGLAIRAGELGYACAVAVPGERFEPVRRDEFVVDPCDPVSLKSLLSSCEAEDGRPPLGVVHLLSLDSMGSRIDEPADVDREISRGCRTALLLTQEILQRWPTDPPRLWLVTRGAQATGGGSTIVSPVQASLWGFGRTIAGEHPELWGGLIDLDPAASGFDEGLLQAIFQPDGEDQIALRGGRRLVPRLGLFTASPSDVGEVAISADVTYLVTGATGGIGLHIARWLVEQGARHIALMGRREPGEDAERVFAALHDEGVQVSFYRGDVARTSELAAILRSAAETMPPLRGVFHLAGVFDDAVITGMTWEKFENVLAPKVRGTWNLHALTRDIPLEMFAIFASGASFLGPTGLSNYAAANAFQDALAFQRRTQRLPAVSIDWGPWARTGMAEAVGLEREAQWARGGFETMPVRDALQALEIILSSQAVNVAALPADWQAFSASLGARVAPPFYHRVISGPPSGAPRSPRSKKSGLDRASLLRLDHEVRVDRIAEFLRAEAAAELGMDMTDLDSTRSLADFGFDSLMAVQLKNRLQAAIGVSARVSTFVVGKSVCELASEIESLLEGDSISPLRGDPLANPEELLEGLDGLSDEQVDVLLRGALSGREDEV